MKRKPCINMAIFVSACVYTWPLLMLVTGPLAIIDGVALLAFDLTLNCDVMMMLKFAPKTEF